MTEKKSQAARFEQELSQAQLMATRGTKRKMNSGGLVVSYTLIIVSIHPPYLTDYEVRQLQRRIKAT